jgi:hypothetical protein
MSERKHLFDFLCATSGTELSADETVKLSNLLDRTKSGLIKYSNIFSALKDIEAAAKSSEIILSKKAPIKIHSNVAPISEPAALLSPKQQQQDEKEAISVVSLAKDAVPTQTSSSVGELRQLSMVCGHC